MGAGTLVHSVSSFAAAQRTGQQLTKNQSCPGSGSFTGTEVGPYIPAALAPPCAVAPFSVLTFLWGEVVGDKLCEMWWVQPKEETTHPRRTPSVSFSRVAEEPVVSPSSGVPRWACQERRVCRPCSRDCDRVTWHQF